MKAPITPAQAWAVLEAHYGWTEGGPVIPLVEQVKVLTAERDALKEDTARYKFMKTLSRACSLDMNGMYSWSCQIMRNDIRGATLDEAIDNAMKAAK